MNKLIRSGIICTILLIIPISITGMKRELIDFELKDQSGKIHSSYEYYDKPLIILGSDRKGSEYVAEWGLKIINILKNHPGQKEIYILGVADLSGMPVFVRPIISKRLTQTMTILLDDTGIFSKCYNFKNNSVNIIFFDKKGNIINQFSVKGVTPQSLEQITKSIQVI